MRLNRSLNRWSSLRRPEKRFDSQLCHLDLMVVCEHWCRLRESSPGSQMQIGATALAPSRAAYHVTCDGYRREGNRAIVNR